MSKTQANYVMMIGPIGIPDFYFAKVQHSTKKKYERNDKINQDKQPGLLLFTSGESGLILYLSNIL